MKKIALLTTGAALSDGSATAKTVITSLSEFNTETFFFNSFEQLNPDEFDALVIPEGQDLLKSSTTFEADGERFKVHEALEKIILKFHQQSKPIGAVGLAPLLAAQVLKKYHPLITLGETSDLIPKLKKMNIQHESCPSSDYITDRDCKLLSTPAYMNDGNTSSYTGIRLMIKELVEMA